MRCIFFLSLLTFVIHVAAVPLYIDNSRLFEGPSKPSSSIPFWQQNTAAAQHSDIRIYRNLIPRISPTVIGAGRDWFIGLVSGGLFTAALASLTASTGGSPFSRTWYVSRYPSYHSVVTKC